MDNGKLRELGEKLELSGKDIKSIRHAKLKEYWLYPITGACTFLASIILAWVGAQSDEKVMIRSNGGEYEYPTCVNCDESAKNRTVFFYGLVAAIGPLAALRKTRGMERPKKLKILFFATVIAIVSVVISYMTYSRFYEHFRPVEYHGAGIEYSVFSREPNAFAIDGIGGS
jgi:hypothetical protein